MNIFHNKRKTVSMTAKIISVISALFVITLVATLFSSQLIPLKYSLLTAIASGIIVFLTVFYSFKQTKQRLKVGVIVVSLALIIISCIGIKLTFDGLKLLHNFTSDNTITKRDVATSRPFNLYISGIDTYGDIDTISRSDVNIVATINPITKQILLTSIPRDSYVPIAGGGNNQYDKLTHSGTYGIDASAATVSTLLDTNIDNYTRINFTSFIEIIDEIGGVDVNNPVAFTTDSGEQFPAGTLQLNGKKALTFSRERHNLSGGDNDRGLNQERVVAATFKKLSSPSSLQRYPGILSVVGNSIQTNISEQSLKSLINQQLSDSGNWNITMNALIGKGQTGGLPSYAMPGSQLYMYVLNEASVKAAQSRINTLLQGTK